jgi:chromosome partitioning protein
MVTLAGQQERVMKTILVANRKGGCGKSLVSITLAGALANRGVTVTLADADRQKSSLRWGKSRPAVVAPINLVDWTGQKAGDLTDGTAWLVIDSPGALRGKRAEALIGSADFLVVPILPSRFDSEGTRQFLRDIEDIKRVRKGRVPILLVGNRMRAGFREMRRLDAIALEIGMVPVARISDRAAYADLAAQGLSVFDQRQKNFVELQAQWLPLLKALDTGIDDGSGHQG